MSINDIEILINIYLLSSLYVVRQPVLEKRNRTNKHQLGRGSALNDKRKIAKE